MKLLTDPKLTGIAAWGLAAPGAEEPSPATFVLDASGKVLYRKLGDRSGDWPKYADVAAAL